MGWPIRVLAVVVIVVTLLVWLIVGVTDRCEKRGGEMKGTGEYYSTVILVNNIPIAQTHEKMECTAD